MLLLMVYGLMVYVLVGTVCAVVFAWLVLTTAASEAAPEPTAARVLPFTPHARHVPLAVRQM